MQSEDRGANLPAIDADTISHTLWRYFHASGLVASETLHLLPNGRIDGYSHPNEAFWRLEDGVLAFVHKDQKTVTTRFHDVTMQEGKLLLSGKYLFDSSGQTTLCLKPSHYHYRATYPNCTLRLQGERPLLFVCFGGRGEVFSWSRRMQGLKVNCLHFKDSLRRWYLDGADGFPSFETVLEECRKEMARLADCKTVFLGQSFGAYAALRAAAALKPDLAVVFAPQTHNITHRAIYEKQANFSPPPDTVDIRPLLIRSGVRATIFVSRTEAENKPSAYFWDDHSHLEGLHGVPSITIRTMEFHTHPVAWHMAQADTLDAHIEHELASLSWSDAATAV